MSLRMFNRGLNIRANNPRCKGINENRGTVQHLMSGAQTRGSQRGQTRLSRLHMCVVLGARYGAVHRSKKNPGRDREVVVDIFLLVSEVIIYPGAYQSEAIAVGGAGDHKVAVGQI